MLGIPKTKRRPGCPERLFKFRCPHHCRQAEWLEHELKGQHHRPRVAREHGSWVVEVIVVRDQHASLCSRESERCDVVQIAADELRMVEKVEGIRAELHAVALRDVEALRNVEVNVVNGLSCRDGSTCGALCTLPCDDVLGVGSIAW